MIVLGACVYIIATLSRPVFVGKSYKGMVDLLLRSIKLEFQKNNPVSLFSFLQLFGVVCVAVGVVETLLRRHLNDVPILLVTFLELFMPIALTLLIVRMFQKTN